VLAQNPFRPQEGSNQATSGGWRGKAKADTAVEEEPSVAIDSAARHNAAPRVRCVQCEIRLPRELSGAGPEVQGLSTRHARRECAAEWSRREQPSNHAADGGWGRSRSSPRE
jgi:hypothetical protein